MNYISLYDFLSGDFLSSLNFGQVTSRQNTMHMSPPCIRTGGLKNEDPTTTDRLGIIERTKLEFPGNYLLSREKTRTLIA